MKRIQFVFFNAVTLRQTASAAIYPVIGHTNPTKNIENLDYGRINVFGK